MHIKTRLNSEVRQGSQAGYKIFFFLSKGKVVTKTSEEREKEKHEERTGDPTQMVFDAVMAAPCTVMVSYFTKQLLFFNSYLYYPQ
jgi:hypothetical protein